VITAAVALPIVLLAVYAGTIAISCLAAVAAAAAGWELAGMAREGDAGRRNMALVLWPPALVGIAAAHASGAIADPWWPVAAAIVAGTGAVLAIGWFAAFSRGSPLTGRALAAVLAAAYFGLLLALSPELRARIEGFDWILIALLTTFAADTAAFFVGRAWGRHRLAPRISPRKTWEGAAGGVAGSVAIAVVLVAALRPGLPLWSALLLGLAAAVAGMAGDLAVSRLKRGAGLKDSGGLLPGHGGILDRLDSLAPNIGVVYLFALWAAT